MTTFYRDEALTLYEGDALRVLRSLPAESVDCCVTSPPYYGLRDYDRPGQYGHEATPGEYVATLAAVFAEVRRVLTTDGTLWLNLGDSYSSRVATRLSSHQDGLFPGRDDLRKDWKRDRERGLTRMPSDFGLSEKNLLGIPWRVAFALQDDGWILRNDIVWSKPNGMPESVRDRLASKHELVFLFSKSRRYWFDLDPIREPVAHPAAADGTRVFGGKRGGAGKVGSAYRTRGGMPNLYKQRPGADKNGAHPVGRNPGDVWSITTQPFTEAHFAVMPIALAERCIHAGCRPGGTVLDPFSGSGTTGLAAARQGKRYVGIDLNPDYLQMSLRTRLAQTTLIDAAHPEHRGHPEEPVSPIEESA